MEFKQVAESGTLKQIGSSSRISLKMRDVAEKCKLVKTDSGLKIECTYMGTGAGSYLQYIEKNREQLTQYLMNPDIADFYDWMEASHQTYDTLRRHEKELLILYVNFDLDTMIMETGISDEQVTMKLGAPLVRIDISSLSRNEFKLKVYNMLLLADEIAIAMGNADLRQMSQISMVKTYLSEIYDKYHGGANRDDY
ncbi:MAG: hypothetical protein IJQ12_03375 [Lachnospiraceae bacterium]|nr:hypothetical protein [Lachnospiraceae bacterium]